MTDRLEVHNLFKVFGPDADTAVALARDGVAKDDIFRRTGSVIAVDDVSLTVPEGEIFVVMGLSGSGKSTLVRCLNRLIEPTGGRVLLDGEDVTRADGERLRQIRLHKIAMVFQHFALLPHRTVAENVEYGLKVRGLAAAERRAKAIEALEVVGLTARADSYPHELSGGMQQRVGLARGLAVDPEILLMDEPFSALDPLIRREMRAELIQIQRRFGTTIVFITHDLHEALELGHQIAIMKDGRFVQVGGPEEIVTAPADDYVAAFTSDVDRARVLTAASVLSPVEPLVAGRDTVATACARGGTLPVVNGAGAPIGLARAADLHGHPPDAAIETAMCAEFPIVSAGTRVDALLDRCADGLPVAVTCDAGRLIGLVRPRDLIAALAAASDGRETPSDG